MKIYIIMNGEAANEMYIFSFKNRYTCHYHFKDKVFFYLIQFKNVIVIGNFDSKEDVILCDDVEC